LGFRLIGRGSDRQPVHALATTSYSLAQHSDIFQNGEDRSLAVVPEPDHRGAYRSAACFLAVGMADMSLKREEPSKREGRSRDRRHNRMCRFSAKDELRYLNC